MLPSKTLLSKPQSHQDFGSEMFSKSFTDNVSTFNVVLPPRLDTLKDKNQIFRYIENFLVTYLSNKYNIIHMKVTSKSVYTSSNCASNNRESFRTLVESLVQMTTFNGLLKLLNEREYSFFKNRKIA